MNKNITNRVSLSLDSYLVEVNNYRLQTVEEQTELAHHIKEGDEEALAQLITGNLRFVVSVAKQYLYRGKSMEELIEAGNKGLELAAKKFDPQRGFKFVAYAVWFIRASILAFLETSKNDLNLSDLTKEEKQEMVSKMSNERDKEILTKWFGLPQEETLLIYSSWDGYYKDPEQVKVNPKYKEFRGMFHNVVDIHTSGHADRKTIEKVIKTVNPKEVICIHKEADAML